MAAPRLRGICEASSINTMDGVNAFPCRAKLRIAPHIVIPTMFPGIVFEFRL